MSGFRRERPPVHDTQLVSRATRDEQVGAYLDALCKQLHELRDAVQALAVVVPDGQDAVRQHLHEFDVVTLQAAVYLDALGARPSGWDDRVK